MAHEIISQKVADILLAKAQEILDIRNNDKSLTEYEQDVLHASVKRIEAILANEDFKTAFDPCTGKMSFVDKIIGESLAEEEMHKVVDEPDYKVWRVNHKGKHFACVGIEAHFHLSDRTWKFHARTFNPNRPRRPRNLDDIRVGGTRSPISEISCGERWCFTTARKIAYAIVHSNIK